MDRNEDAQSALGSERARLQHELAELDGGDARTYDSNFADTSQVAAERGEADALVRELKEALDQVDAAIARIEDGSYGVCDRCGEPIGADRLEAIPTAAQCFACASTS